MSEYFKRIIEAANDLHEAIYTFQNSGEVDEFKCSEYLMKADDFREELFEFEEECKKESLT